MTELVTILGSCRQTPIKKYYPDTDIQEEITYPHYTKEVLQTIQYLKYRNFTEEQTKNGFRSGLLSKCTKGIDDSMYFRLKEQFDNTTFFLIEIASRKVYYWKGKYMYLHEIAIDPKYEFPEPENIIVTESTDQEIEQDLIQIKSELYPKKMLVISHFSTYNHGKRYELTKTLEKICKKLEIPFLNQSVLVEKYGMETINQRESKYAHFTEYGNKCMGEILYEKMQQVSLETLGKNRF